MASGRMLSKDASIDPDLNALSLEAEMLYLLTLPHLDRDGLITGDPVLLWAQAAPKRLALLDIAPRLIQEWIDRGLVERYAWKDGPILFFPGFRKHNRQLDYAREAASRFPPPPGYYRSAAGLVPDDPDLAAQAATHFDPRSSYYAALTAAAIPQVTTKSRPTREQVATSSRPARDTVVPQDQDQVQDQDHSDDDDGCRHLDLVDEDVGQPATDPDPAPPRPPRAMMDELALELMGSLPWQGAPAFLDSLDDTQRLCLLTWLWLWDVWDGTSRYDLNTPRLRYRSDPWEGVKNVVGKIITQTRRKHPAPLHPDDLAELKAVLNERIAELAPDAVLFD